MKPWIAVRIVRHGSGRFAIEAQCNEGKVKLIGAPQKGGDYGRHGALGQVDNCAEMLKRFILGEVRSGDIEVEGDGKKA